MTKRKRFPLAPTILPFQEEEPMSRSLNDEEKEPKWPILHISEKLGEFIRESKKEVALLTPASFDALLKLLAYEAYFENDSEGFGFYYNRNLLIKAFQEQNIYGLKIQIAKDEAEWFRTELGQALARFGNDFCTQRNRISSSNPFIEKLMSTIFIDVTFRGLLIRELFLPFLCWVQETDHRKYGSIEVIWTHQSFRNLGIAKCFLDWRHTRDVCSTLASAIAAPRRTELIPVKSRANLVKSMYLIKAKSGSTAKKLFDAMVPFVDDEEEVEEKFFDGVISNRLYWFVIRDGVLERVLKSWEDDAAINEFHNHLLYNQKENAWVLPFVCILDEKGGYDLLWSHPCIACLELEQYLHEKRVRKFVPDIVDGARSFWDHMGFATQGGVDGERDYLDEIEGSVETGMLFGKETLVRSGENCQKLASMITKHLGSEYECAYLDGGIHFLRCPGGWVMNNAAANTKQVRFDGCYSTNEISLRFKWTNAKWDARERITVIACFMKVFGFDRLDHAFYQKEEIEEFYEKLF